MSNTKSILMNIEGGSAFVRWLCKSESQELDFHDSELVELCLRRSGSSILKMWVLQTGGSGRAAWVSFLLEDTIDVSLEGFMHQNVIGGLEIGIAEHADIHPSLLGIGGSSPKHVMHLEPCAGAFGVIKATISKVEFIEIETQ